MSNAFISFAQTQVEETMRTAEALLQCRTLEDMTNVQTQFMQQSFDRFLAEANKLAQSTASLAKDTANPLRDQMERFVERMSRAA